jgi:hypothetical protein
MWRDLEKVEVQRPGFGGPMPSKCHCEITSTGLLPVKDATGVSGSGTLTPRRKAYGMWLQVSDARKRRVDLTRPRCVDVAGGNLCVNKHQSLHVYEVEQCGPEMHVQGSAPTPTVGSTSSILAAVGSLDDLSVGI